MKKCLEGIIYGRVQLVMFRDFVTRHAKKLGLAGRVKNNPDGTVWFVAEGDEEALRLLLERVRKGPMLSRVDRVEDTWKEATGQFSDFQIVFYD